MEGATERSRVLMTKESGYRSETEPEEARPFFHAPLEK